MYVIDGIPLHPLVVHAVVVLLPLAGLGAVAIAVHRSWRRHIGVPVLLVALVGVISVPVATETGEQLEAALGGNNPLVEVHSERAEMLLPFAAAFVVLLAAAVIVELTTTRASGAHSLPATSAGQTATRTSTSMVATRTAPQTTTATRARLAAGLAVLAALAGIVVIGLVVWIGHAGATAAWQGVGQ